MKKEIKVHLLAFDSKQRVRAVEIDYHDGMSEGEILNATFEWGQNDFQPQNMPSVSAGDVIELDDGKKVLICAVGFKEMTEAEFVDYRGLTSVERAFKGFEI